MLWHAPPRHLRGMSTYRRVWMPGDTCFFTVNLLERRRRLLIEHIDDLRAAFRASHRVRPFDMLASLSFPTTCVAFGACRMATPTTPIVGRRSSRCFHVACPRRNCVPLNALHAANAAFGNAVARTYLTLEAANSLLVIPAKAGIQGL